jgi:rRNA maturation endonuclease Nob1
MIAQKRKDLVLVFDTNVFLTGIDFNLIPNKIYTTSKVIDEINVSRYKEKNRNILTKIYAAIENKKLIVKNPALSYLESVQKSSKLTGDFKVLSDVDFGIVALALEMMQIKKQEVIIYTNDYSMENLCSELKISFKPLYKKGIQEKKNFEVYCPNCHSQYETLRLNTLCDRCGIRLKRRPK